MPRYSDLLPYQPLPGRGGRLSDLSRQELETYVDQVAPDAALRFGNMARADYPYSMDGQGMRQALEGELQRMDKGMQGQTLDQAAVATAGVPILGDAVGLAADAKAVYDDPSWVNIGGAALGALPFVPAMAAIRNVRPAKENIASVADANFAFWRKGGNKMMPIEQLRGGVGAAADDAERVKRLADAISGPDGYIERLLVDQNGNVIEGQHRLDALRALGEPKVPVTVIEDMTEGAKDVRKAIEAAGMKGDQAHYMTQRVLDAWAEDAANIADYGYDNPALDRAFQAGVKALQQPPPSAKIRAYHGSPHDFDKFDMSKIGTGEGARNYVVFDDKLIDIVRKYGIGALLGGTGAFGLMSLQGEDGTEPPL